jgi:isocitrate/isopropylmalate dehydrogenase
MSTHNIVVFAGDHCGPEVVNEAVKVRLSLQVSLFLYVFTNMIKIAGP